MSYTQIDMRVEPKHSCKGCSMVTKLTASSWYVNMVIYECERCRQKRGGEDPYFYYLSDQPKIDSNTSIIQK